MNETVSTLKWYKEPWPWIIMAGPAIVVVAGLFTAFLALNTDDGLVADDYYKQGLAINRTLQRSEVAYRSGITADISLPMGKGSSQINLRLRGDHRFADRLGLSIVHPTQAGQDVSVLMIRQPDGNYAGQISGAISGHRIVIIEDGDWRLTGDWDLAKESSTHLRATTTN